MVNEDTQLLVVGVDDVTSVLSGREEEVLQAVAQAYVSHGRGDSSLPHSIFLRFPDDDTNRIIGLPAYLGDDFQVSGMKWIASYPGNVGRGLPRASAVLVLNSTSTGRPYALLESSIISARRTAASAALAAARLTEDRPPEVAGLVGTGLINLEVARFLRVAVPSLDRFVLFDLDRERAERFGGELVEAVGEVEVGFAASTDEVLADCPLVSFATTARPHVDSLDPCPPGATILHVSLRDLTPAAILSADNVVDDPDHVCRAETSVHLAEQETGNRDHIRCTLADILEGRQPARVDGERVTVFSPFGLGVLDLALGKLVYDEAQRQGLGTTVDSFLPSLTVGATA